MDAPNLAEAREYKPLQEKLLSRLVWDESKLEHDRATRGELVEELFTVQTYLTNPTKTTKMRALLWKFVQEIWKTFYSRTLTSSYVHMKTCLKLT